MLGFRFISGKKNKIGAAGGSTIMRCWLCVGFLFILAACVVNPPPAPAVAPPATQASVPNPLVYSQNRAVISGTKQKIGFMYSINPDCSSMGYATIRVVTPSGHGSVTFEPGDDFTASNKDNQRYPCNLKQSPGNLIYYQSVPGFIGTDAVVLDVILPSGNLQTITYNITVK